MLQGFHKRDLKYVSFVFLIINIQTPTVINLVFGATTCLEGLMQIYLESYFTQLKNKMQLNATSTQDWC